MVVVRVDLVCSMIQQEDDGQGEEMMNDESDEMRGKLEIGWTAVPRSKSSNKDKGQRERKVEDMA